MPTLISYLTRSKWCAIAATAITLLALIPQLHFWISRGSQWHGAYTILQMDEVLYSAYINALIDGRPRRNDAATGQDDHPQAPLPESLFSIQFIPAYAIALPARALHLSASTAFIVLNGAAGLLASLFTFWLLFSIIGDTRFAATGVLIVLCFGAFAGGQGLFILGLPFLRRYEPSAPFPFIFVFCTLTWKALTTRFSRSGVVKALLAGVTLSFLVFSYFYLWTAAAAWFVCVGVLWLILRPGERAVSLIIIVIISSPVILALWSYAQLVARLPSALDKAQVLSFSHRPDLFRMPEIVGACILVALVLAVLRNRVSRHAPRVVLAASFALLPFVVFNQQVVTGRSIQPYHYEIFVANYLVLLGLVITVKILQPAISYRTTMLIASACLLLGSINVSLAIHYRYDGNVRIDEMIPVLLRLKEQAINDGTWQGLRDRGKAPALVFSPQYGISSILPTWAPQGSLLAPASVAFQSLSETERKERLYQHFYYCGRNPEYLRELLNDRTDDTFLTHFVKSTIFGPERDVPFLSQEFQPIREDEIKREVSAYNEFVHSFSREQTAKHPLAYAITAVDRKFDFSNIDLWYERDAGEQVGTYVLFRLKLRG